MVKHERDDGTTYTERKNIEVQWPIDIDGIQEAAELLAVRWKPTWLELNGPPPQGIPHQTFAYWTEMKAAEGNKDRPGSSATVGQGTLGMDDDEFEEFLGG